MARMIKTVFVRTMEIRCFALEQVTFEALENKVRGLYGIGEAEKLSVGYVDEEQDFVSVGSTEELAVGLAWRDDKKPLKLFVKVAAAQKEQKEAGEQKDKQTECACDEWKRKRCERRRAIWEKRWMMKRYNEAKMERMGFGESESESDKSWKRGERCIERHRRHCCGGRMERMRRAMMWQRMREMMRMRNLRGCSELGKCEPCRCRAARKAETGAGDAEKCGMHHGHHFHRGCCRGENRRWMMKGKCEEPEARCRGHWMHKCSAEPEHQHFHHHHRHCDTEMGWGRRGRGRGREMGCPFMRRRHWGGCSGEREGTSVEAEYAARSASASSSASSSSSTSLSSSESLFDSEAQAEMASEEGCEQE
ncbi:uncharacterized protein MONOS_245 [Monocercomonoides exilis]|uniref:uncharacterized protein n=1 Tax=Monocercomonoides exilis TaxID=2049356 RepID=UPI00355A55C1|nr:hypothetical protein MONOS_245 [Monocercomonoides exilis]|eukprot:MONOS_245.1-p1 / transcript=MONOS_245.1 / gene=MONOS_245 / organism=Monocercomonoides_exilis_PA203 / gene_product=unspecified product / transcript_product=unspecified product / location=Mono_scaffold00004:107424-108515(-) / protein_length=363 / sequence_SO=supercontig / SO=protein_coding / is_pseudo=false